MRVAKVLRFAGTTTNVGFDFYNLFNANTGTAFNQGRRHLQPCQLAQAHDRVESSLRAVQLDSELLKHGYTKVTKNTKITKVRLSWPS
jgi:hypothetical protein